MSPATALLLGMAWLTITFLTDGWPKIIAAVAAIICFVSSLLSMALDR